MKLDRRIPSHLFIIAYVFFLSEYCCIYYLGITVTYLVFIKLNAIFIPWNTKKKFQHYVVYFSFWKKELALAFFHGFFPRK